MSLHRKRKILRWSIRILLILVLLPVAMLILVRQAGWLRMRKHDLEIRSALAPHQVNETIDTFRIRGRNIVYLKTSKGNLKDEAMILVHGSPGSLDAFLDYMSDTSLLARVDLVTYDRPGYGNSDFGQSLPSLTGQSNILNGIMEQLGYRQYWLAGHSYGAPILLHTAMHHPEKIAGISLISGSVSPDLEPKSVSWRKWMDMPVFRGLLPISMKVSNEELMPIRQDLNLIEDDWDGIEMPVSIIHGTRDVLVPFANVQYAEDKLTRADTVLLKVFEGESHFILWTHENEIVTELVKLIDTRNGL